jgi:MGT family glycosyltransferase
LDPNTAGAPMRRFREPRKTPAPLTDYWGGRKDPLVYLTLGTVVGTMGDLHSAYRVALQAVAGLPIRVLLTTGADLPSDALGTVPDNVHVEKFVPQDDILPLAAAVICHGGSGTVIGTLAAGVPMVVVPQFADQPTNAQRVQALGAGLALPTRTATASELRAALLRVLEDGSFRAAAAKLSVEIAGLPAIDAAPKVLAEFAR